MNRHAASPLPVVILSGGVTGLGVLRAFARQGIPAFVYPTALTDPIRHSRWYRALPGVDDRSPAPAPSVALLDRVLAGSGLPGAFLCPCCDDWNSVVAAFAERSPGAFVSMVPTSAALGTLQDKANLAVLLQTLGVPMPKTRVIASSGDISELPPSDDTFYFLKPRDSQRFRARFGTKGIRVRDAGEARRRLDEMFSATMGAVLQEYIPGPPEQHYFVDGYADHAGAIKALFARRRGRIYPSDFGNSTSLASVPLSDIAGAIDSVHRVLAAVNYRGIFSVEFKRDPRDAAFKLLEVNARPWWFVDFAVRCGVDVCRMAYDDAQGCDVSALETYSLGATCIFPYRDFLAMQPLVAAGQASWWRWLAEVIKALQPLGCMDDPVPGIVAAARLLSRALRNRLTHGDAPPLPVLE